MLRKFDLSEEEVRFLVAVLNNTEFKAKGLQLVQYGRLLDGLLSKLQNGIDEIDEVKDAISES